MMPTANADPLAAAGGLVGSESDADGPLAPGRRGLHVLRERDEAERGEDVADPEREARASIEPCAWAGVEIDDEGERGMRAFSRSKERVELDRGLVRRPRERGGPHFGS